MAEAAADAAGVRYELAGPHAVAIDDGEWFDAGRARRLRWRCYRPQIAGPVSAVLSTSPETRHRFEMPAPFVTRTPFVARTPFVIHSHGLGGSCASGADWLAHWASWGIAGLAVQHPGSDVDASASASPLALRHLLRTAVDAAQLAARRDDLLFALDRIADMITTAGADCVQHAVSAAATDIAGIASTDDATDASHTTRTTPAIGLSGHSFGAASVLRLIGERRGDDDRPADPRIAAAVLFSPSARGGRLPLAERFSGVRIPCLHLTGTLDSGIGPGDISAADRLLPFAHMPAPEQYLLLLDGATHPEFSGQGGEGAGTARPARRVALKAASTAFWLAQLAGDAQAAAWLARPSSLVEIAGRWQRK